LFIKCSSITRVQKIVGLQRQKKKGLIDAEFLAVKQRDAPTSVFRGGGGTLLYLVADPPLQVFRWIRSDMKPSTSHQSSNNHRLATSSLTLLASCAASSTASRCCAVLWPGNQSGHAKIPAPEFGEVVHQEANDRPPAPHMFLHHHRRPPRDPRWIDGWIMDAQSA